MRSLKKTLVVAWLATLVTLMCSAMAKAAAPDASHAEATAMVRDIEANRIKDLDDAQLVARFQ